jgi:alpha-beta hydrolase superfamily lysophospholipase
MVISRFWLGRWNRIIQLAILLVVTSLPLSAQRKDIFMRPPVQYKNITVNGLNIFYREAGPANAPVILLLHGLPSSSRMFEPLFARLSNDYHLIAPDYPGFGHSDWPDRPAC